MGKKAKKTLLLKEIHKVCKRNLEHCPNCEYAAECAMLMRCGVPKMYQFEANSDILNKDYYEILRSR